MVTSEVSNIFWTPEKMPPEVVEYYTGLNLITFWKLVDQLRPKLSRRKLSVASIVLLYRFGTINGYNFTCCIFQLLLFRLKVRFDLPNQFIGQLFGIKRDKVWKYFWSCAYQHFLQGRQAVDHSIC